MNASAPAAKGHERLRSDGLPVRRNLVERFFNKLRHCRRVANRYDKLAPTLHLLDLGRAVQVEEPATKGWTSAANRASLNA
jgi:transposase